MPRKKFKCPKCKRSFKMAAHLGRHTSTMHGGAKRKAARKTKHPGGAKRRGRPPGIASKLDLRSLTFEQLKEVVQAARDEAQRRMSEFQATFG